MAVIRARRTLSGALSETTSSFSTTIYRLGIGFLVLKNLVGEVNDAFGCWGCEVVDGEDSGRETCVWLDEVDGNTRRAMAFPRGAERLHRRQTRRRFSKDHFLIRFLNQYSGNGRPYKFFDFRLGQAVSCRLKTVATSPFFLHSSADNLRDVFLNACRLPSRNC